jgi:hypothetical protein
VGVPVSALEEVTLMKGVLLLIVGAAAGFVIAHQVSKTPQGREFFANVDAKAKEFGDAVVDGYRAREAELRHAVADAQAAVVDITKRAK